MEVVKTVQEMISASRQWAGDDVGFVPTMGYLHEGHLSLMRRARKENSRLVASIFVNPTQFGPQEDLERYPRNLSRDLQLLEAERVDHVFVPPANQIYPPGFVTYVEPTGPLATACEGTHRPGHFRGVATVVLKLFELVRPHRAYFGQKDAQQVAVITRMVADLNLPVQLIIMPTVREPDGLAMSSRNSYLDPQSRATATALYRALQAGRQVFDAHLQEDPQLVERAMINVIDAEPEISLDYAQVRDPGSFTPLETLRAPALLVIAANIGQVRLIDNFLLRTDGSWDTGIAVSER
ncbi:MAG TPA: pantoate--beta-alanine ligase [Ktedonobacteraceae bacterium]|nr:pantoate--beta-alanine ligase [Ktedonobacteraceae bacterium]